MYIRIGLLLIILSSPTLLMAEAGHDEHEEEGRLHLTEAQRKTAGIVVTTLQRQPIPTEIEAPAEVRNNAYMSSQIVPRIQAQVIKRHVRLGNVVKAGQTLVTLSSVAVAEAQSDLLMARQEWYRVKKLGTKIIAERNYQQAQMRYQQARAKLLAYGLSKQQINKTKRADGRFTLLSLQRGRVIKDDFIIGQMAEAGTRLFEITDESRLWINAQVNPEIISQLKLGTIATVMLGKTTMQAKITQIFHQVDETTRKLQVRLTIDNGADKLHAGQFVVVHFKTGVQEKSAFLLPLNAVLRSADGDWEVLIEEEPNEFEPKEVTLLQHLSGQVVIQGLENGVKVVTQGAFFIQSELAKSGFDIHNH